MIKFDASGAGWFWNRCLQFVSAAASVRSLAMISAAVMTAGSVDARVIYVDADAKDGGDGFSWSRAFNYLRDALDSSNPGDEIFVAEGVYFPDDGASGFFGDRELSFELDRVKIYGGFAGTETNVAQRDPVAHPTILSGEIWEVIPDDPATDGYERYWSLHVVVLQGNATLDGVIIERGRANGDEAPYNRGGAILAPNNTVATLVNCILRENLACESGGAVWGTVKATDCIFIDNEVDNEFLKTANKKQRSWLYNDTCYGGAINGDVTATGCKFVNNIVNTSSLRSGTTTTAVGGAINGTTLILNDCVFDSNKAISISFNFSRTGSDATSRGGAVAGKVTAKNCKFLNNVAQADSYSDYTPKPKPDTPAAPYTSKPTTLGGAIIGQIDAANCAFDNNVAIATAVEGDNTNIFSQGGALYVENASTLVNCTFTKNDASYVIMPAVNSDPNNAPSSAAGGGIYASSSSVLPIMNCTFLDNNTTLTIGAGAAFEGAGTALYVGGAVNILSNIFWSNADGETLIWVPATENAKARISNRLYPTPSTETINIVKGSIDGVNIIQANADLGEPPTRTLLSPVEPIFVDPLVPAGPDGAFGTPDDGLRLIEASPAIGLGHPLFIPKDTLDLDEDKNVTELVPVDIANYQRVQNETLDLGAYEFGTILLAPDIQVEQPAGLILVDGVGTVNFGAAPGAPSVKTFVIKNTGFLPLKRLLVTKSGTHADEFAITQPVQTTLGAGGATSFTVTFDPTVVGLRTAALQIASNDPNEMPFDIAIEGEARIPDISVEYPAETPLTDGTSTINYGSVAALTSSSKTFTVRNTGQGDLAISAVTSTGTNAADFTVTKPDATVYPGGTSTFKVTFSPSAKGTRTATITIKSNDPDAESSFTFKVTGNGVVSPEIAVAQPASKNLVDGGKKSFGSVKTGLAYTKTFTIKNVGSSNLKNISLSITGSNAKLFKLSDYSQSTLKPGTKATFSVTFKPTSTGLKTASLKITSNDADENPFDIELEGTGYTGSSPSRIASLAAVSSSSGLSLSADRAGAGVLTVTKATDGLEYLTLTVPKTVDWGTTKRTAEVSSNLVDWFSGDKHTTILQDDSEVLRVRDNTPVQKGGKRYIRLK